MLLTSFLTLCSPPDESRPSVRWFNPGKCHLWFLTLGFAVCILPRPAVGEYPRAHTCTTWALQGEGCLFKGNGAATLNLVGACLPIRRAAGAFSYSHSGRSELGHFIEVIMMAHAAENVENILLIYSGFKTIKLQISPCSYL